MGMDDMMLFRTAYLRAIARAWNDQKFFNQMTTAVDGWTILQQCIHPPAALPAWSIQLRFKEDVLPGNGYQPALTGSWVGPRAILELRLPPPPKGQAQQSEALAAYYATMPSPFGQKRRGGHPTPEPGDDSAGSPGGAGMGHWEDALVLGGTIMRALALSWSDARFHEQFKGEGALVALQDWLGYTLPWNMQLVAEYVSPEVAHWDSTQQKWLLWQPERKEWSPGVLPNHLTMWVPNAPAPEYPQAVALAAYNQTGDAYPLTCP